MKKNIILRAAFALLFFGMSAAVLAQDAGSLQRELELQVDRPTLPTQVRPSKPVEPKPSKANEQKIAIKAFKFKDNTLLSDAQLQTVVKPWTDRDISFSDLKDVTAAIQQFYAKNNRIVQAIIPPQDIQDGIILIQIIEGKLGAVRVEPALKGATLRIDPDIAKLYLVTNSDGSQYIDTKPLERGMALLNELPGVSASGSFEPGAKAGEANFAVKLTDRPLFAGQAALTNYGSNSTGSGQLMANLSLNNPSGFGDQANFDVIQSLGSTFGQLGYSLPVGYTGWRVGIQGNYLTYQTLSSWSNIQTQGTASTIGANVSYALYREKGNAANLRFGIDDRNYSNNQLGSNISQYQITSFSAGINGNFFDTPKSVISYSLSASLGHLNVQNLTQAGQDETGPGTAGDYQKLSFLFSRLQELEFLPKTTWSLSAYGQLANKNLNSGEQIYLGGPYAVRAYPAGQGGGSQGLIVSTELQHRLDQNWQVGAFADFGLIQQYVTLYPGWQGLTNANNTYQLGSVGPTLKFSYDRLSVNALAAFRIGENPLYNSSGQQLNADNAYKSVQFWVKATYVF